MGKEDVYLKLKNRGNCCTHRREGENFDRLSKYFEFSNN